MLPLYLKPRILASSFTANSHELWDFILRCRINVCGDLPLNVTSILYLPTETFVSRSGRNAPATCRRGLRERPDVVGARFQPGLPHAGSLT